jgi:hypothetical protein
MNSTEITTPMLVDLAMQAEITDPIDWAQLSMEERQAFTLMATSVVEQINGIPEEQRLMVAMATMTKLLVENFVLNVKLSGGIK